MANDSDLITILEDDTCWGYLDSQELGRLATAVNDEPEIFPVNYVVDGQSVVFRTAAGSKLAELTINSTVAFEVDGWDTHKGWSVVIRGSANAVTDPDELAMCDKMPLRPWVPTEKPTFVRIIPNVLTGRVFSFGKQE